MDVIKNFRKSLNLTIEEFAQEIGVSKSLMEKIENGDRGTSRNFLKKLKKRFPQFDVNIFFIN